MLFEGGMNHRRGSRGEKRKEGTVSRDTRRAADELRQRQRLSGRQQPRQQVASKQTGETKRETVREGDELAFPVRLRL